VGTMAGPIRGLVTVLSGPARGFVTCLSQIRDQKEKEEAA
jgi:large subunit ribosomal protein L10